MGISISSLLIKKLPEAEQAPKSELEEILWNKSGGRCFLCDGR